VQRFESLIRDVPDFPEQGVVFKDITPVLGDPEAFRMLIGALAEPFQDQGITKVAGIEARGFTLATPVADRIGAGFIPLRKPGKLPYETVREEYELEYGRDVLAIHQDAISSGQRILAVDDLLATGGTMAATLRLIERLGGTVVACDVLIELTFLKGRERLKGYRVESLITYD